MSFQLYYKLDFSKSNSNKVLSKPLSHFEDPKYKKLFSNWSHILAPMNEGASFIIPRPPHLRASDLRPHLLKRSNGRLPASRRVLRASMSPSLFSRCGVAQGHHGSYACADPLLTPLRPSVKTYRSHGAAPALPAEVSTARVPCWCSSHVASAVGAVSSSPLLWFKLSNYLFK